jgi:LuxR family maltose regulon positive regulatory protein
VLAHAETAVRAFLLATAVLSTFTLEHAQALSGRADAEAILETLRHRQFFITKLSDEPPTYRYHPLFHEFLRHEASHTLPPDEWLRLRLQAAILVEADGWLETAAQLFIEVHAWAELTCLVLRIAPRLVAQGRHLLLEHWIGQVPPAVRDRSAWLLYWRGTAQVYAKGMKSGRRLLERAYAGFESAGEREGLLLAWGGIIETFSFEWDDFSPVGGWLDRVESALPEYLLRLPAPVVERLLSAGTTLEMTHRAHPITLRLVELARTVLDRSDFAAAHGAAITLRLTDLLFSGAFEEAQTMLDTVMGTPQFPHWPPLGQMLFGQMRAVCAWQTGRPDLAREQAAAILRQAEQTGIHVADFTTLAQGAYAALTAWDRPQALEYLARMQVLLRPDRRTEAQHFHSISGVYELDLRGSPRRTT